ncbi:hypothetical protein ABT187_49780, partial [Streptomyces sp. NPDC001817]
STDVVHLNVALASADLAGIRQEPRDEFLLRILRIREDERFVICFNPDAADRDAKVRDRLVAHLTELIDGADKLTPTKRAELRGVISTKPGLNRYLRVTPGGLLRIDAAKIKAEENLDGKYLLRTSDPKTTTEDIALGYKQLLEVERGWRDMKQVIDLRPVFHRKEERIRAHVLLCWLCTAPGPHRRDPDRADLADTAPRTRPDQARYLHRARRHVPAAHRDHQTPTRAAERPQARPTAAVLPAHPHERLTSTNHRP